jgi:hypothetical protein
VRTESPKNAFVHICEVHSEVEAAIRRLDLHGFDMTCISVIACDAPGERDVVGCYRVHGKYKYRGTLSAFWENLWESLDGSGCFWVPEFGWILIAGPLAGWAVAVMDNASLFSGLTVVGSAIYLIGMRSEDVLKYETAIRNGNLLLIAHGSVTAVEDARRIFYGPSQ